MSRTEPDKRTADRPLLAASVEITPRQIEKDPSVLEMVPPATRVYLVDLGTMAPQAWGDLTRRVAMAGLEPVPHIAARRLPSVQALEDRLSAMVDAAGVRDVLLIAGGANPELGPFASSMDVLDTGILDRHGIHRIGVAGHPEGSPDIPGDLADKALQMKQAFAARTEAAVRIVTQFGFDAAAAIAWAQAIRQAGISMPVHLGVAGPASITSLLKYAAMCGVRASSAFAFKRGSAIASLMTSYSPEPFVQPIEQHVADDPGTLVQQLHVFPFGGLAETSRWLVGRGSWDPAARAAAAGLASKSSQDRPGALPRFEGGAA